MNYNHFLNIYGYEPFKGWVGYKKQLNKQDMTTDFHDEFGFGYKPGSATPSPTPSEHEYVDLGLPSGTLWATTNIQDADGNELYFAWGETQGYTAEQVGTGREERAFKWNDYEFGTMDNLSKYNESDLKTELDAADDAATANWGSGWRMPTKEQFYELIENTTKAFTQVDGVNGLLCTSTANTNTLFFPAVGFAQDGEVGDVGDYGICWTANLSNKSVNDAFGAELSHEESFSIIGNGRCSGCSVRPVRIVQ